jgi:hypothetical protein
MSPMHYAAAERLVAEHRTAHEAAAARGRLRRLISRRHATETASPAGPAPVAEPVAAPTPVALTLASYHADKAEPRQRTVA